MYTQCPDCKTAFSVTAEVLKQAAGKVRCGGCGSPFDALNYLSEVMPDDANDSGSKAAAPKSKAKKISVDELRFDDNTPLPDDFDVDPESSSEPPDVAESDKIQDDPAHDKPPPEVSLSEPDEWREILGEFDELAAAVAAPANAEVDEPLDMNSQFAIQAEAMGIDLSGIHERENEELEDENPQLDFVEIQEEPVIENHAIEKELAGTDDEEQQIEHYVPPMTEAEQTINMMIDQDLMALAIEDDDGFASTIALDRENAEEFLVSEEESIPDDAQKLKGFETIIMEGESIHSEIDKTKRAKNAADAAELATIARADAAASAAKSSRMRNGLTSGVVVMLLLLAVQVVHQSREALATIPAISATLSPVYRALGQPLQPAWNITGWRFEKTKGSTQNSDAGELLTIYSQLRNKSDNGLPYPLIGISLTDRFEETIGSRVLDPADYLQNDLDPRKLVAPGNTFDALISIQSPSKDATGFKLNVCYRLSNGKLRCAIEDFK